MRRSTPFSAHFASTPSGQTYWTVVDSASTVAEIVDGYLKFLRLERGLAELTNKQCARNLAYFLTWMAESGLNVESSVAEVRSFSTFLGSQSTISGTQPALHRPERAEQVMATVRGFYTYLVRRGALPLETLDELHEVADLRDSGVRSYAQNGEDIQIAYYVGRDRVTYVDVGCLWPKRLSNTYFFYLRGGCGVCIDANPEIAEEYRADRPRDTFLNCGLAASPGTMTYHMHENPVFNTLSAEHATELANRVAGMEDSPQRQGRTSTGTLEIPVMTLDEAVMSSDFVARCDGRVDFLSIDVEGLELEVLSGFSFDALRPRLVVVEDVRRGREVRLAPEELPVAQAMKAHRYWLAGRSGVNLYFMDERR